MRALVTNDDGIDSPGLAVLAWDAVAAGLDVVVAAPAWDSSGAAASLTGVSEDGRIMVDAGRRLEGGRHGRQVVAFAAQASPAMIVRAGIRGGFGDPPDLVLSGINDGPNTGHAVLHSGTVGAALTAATLGCRAVAFSMSRARAADDDPFGAASAVVRRVLRWTTGADGPMALNVNVPGGSAERMRGLRAAPLAAVGAVQTQVTEVGEGYVGLTFEEVDPSEEPDTDAGLLARGWATVTPLNPVCEADAIDISSLAGDAHRR